MLYIVYFILVIKWFVFVFVVDICFLFFFINVGMVDINLRFLSNVKEF